MRPLGVQGEQQAQGVKPQADLSAGGAMRAACAWGIQDVDRKVGGVNKTVKSACMHSSALYYSVVVL